MQVDNDHRVEEILSWYPHLTSSQKKNLLRIINYGRIGGTGKFVILPVDQGFEHGPSRSFLPQPNGFDPTYHARLAVDGGCNAYAAPKGALEAAADIIAKEELPTILKVNSHDLMMPDASDPFPAITSWVEDAVELECAAVSPRRQKRWTDLGPLGVSPRQWAALKGGRDSSGCCLLWGAYCCAIGSPYYQV